MFMANITRVQPPRACKVKGVIRAKQQLEAADFIGDDNYEQEIKGTSRSEIKVGEKTNAFKGNTTQIPLEGSLEHVHYMDKPNLLTRSTYVLSQNAEFGENFYTQLVLRSNTLGSLIRKFMILIQVLVTFGPMAIKKMNEMALTRTKEFLQREAWRAILLCSQKYYPFKILPKYNVMNVQEVLCKHTTVEPLAISLLGTDATPIISNKDPISKLLINKAHLREIHASVRPIHTTASTTLARLMTGHFGVLLINGEEWLNSLCPLVSPVGRTGCCTTSLLWV